MIVVYVLLGILIFLMTVFFVQLFVYEGKKKDLVIEQHIDDAKIVGKAKEEDVLSSFRTLNNSFIKSFVQS